MIFKQAQGPGKEPTLSANAEHYSDHIGRPLVLVKGKDGEYQVQAWAHDPEKAKNILKSLEERSGHKHRSLFKSSLKIKK